jgi:chitodextrinase
VVKYRKNGTLFYTSIVPPSYPLIVDTSLYTNGSTITNAVIIGGTLVNVDGGANQSPVANAGGPYSGKPGIAVQFNGSNSFDPDGTIANYSWAFGDGTTGSGATPMHSYAAVGNYTATLTVTDNKGATATATANISISQDSSIENVVWTKLVGVSASGNSLTKTAPDGWTNAGASSTRAIASGDGYVECTATETNKDRMCGLGNVDGSPDYRELKYAVDMTTGGVAWVFESGTIKGNYVIYQAGDRFRIAVEGGVVKYRRNGTLFYTTSVPPTYPLIVDTSLYTNGSTITNAVISGNLVNIDGGGNQSPVANAGGPYSGKPGIAVQFNGSNSFDPDGTIANYSWAFGDGTIGSGATPMHVYGAVGNYTAILTVTDNKGATASAPANVGISQDSSSPENVVWTNVIGGSASGNNLTKNAPDGWTNAGASSTRGISFGDGYAEFTATEANKDRMFGLNNVDGNQDYRELKYAIDAVPNGVAWVFESGTIKGNYVLYQSGDRFRIAVEGGVVKYLKNGTVFYTSLIAPKYPLIVDTSLFTNGSTITNAVISGNLVTPGPSLENMIWTKAIGVSVSGNNLTKLLPEGWTNAGASSTRAIAFVDGYAEFTATETNKDRMFGLNNVDGSQDYRELKYAKMWCLTESPGCLNQAP